MKTILWMFFLAMVFYFGTLAIISKYPPPEPLPTWNVYMQTPDETYDTVEQKWHKAEQVGEY